MTERHAFPRAESGHQHSAEIRLRFGHGAQRVVPSGSNKRAKCAREWHVSRDSVRPRQDPRSGPLLRAGTQRRRVNPRDE